MQLLKTHLEKLRRAMHAELELAGGDHRAPSVQSLAAEFDRLFAVYMRRQLRSMTAKRAPGENRQGLFVILRPPSFSSEEPTTSAPPRGGPR